MRRFLSRFQTLSLSKNRDTGEIFSPAHLLILFFLTLLLFISFFLDLRLAFQYGAVLGITLILAWVNRFFSGRFFLFCAKLGLTAVIVFIFSSLGCLIPQIHPVLYDQKLLFLDRLIFGESPVIVASKYLNLPVLAGILQIAYCSYFFFVLSAGIYSFVREREVKTDFILFSIALGFLGSYVGYILVPALGPRDPLEETALAPWLLVSYPAPLQGFSFTPVLREILNHAEKIKMNAFPSGHTTLTLLTLRHYYRLNRKGFYFLLPWGAAIILATLVCRYHYAVDIFAGLILFLGISLVDRRIFLWLKRKIRQTKKH